MDEVILYIITIKLVLYMRMMIRNMTVYENKEDLMKDYGYLQIGDISYEISFSEGVARVYKCRYKNADRRSKTIIIQDSVNYNGTVYPVAGLCDRCFDRCHAENIIIPTSVDSMCGTPFSNCLELVSITIPDIPIEWGYYDEPFNIIDNCPNLKDIKIDREDDDRSLEFIDGCLFDLKEKTLIAYLETNKRKHYRIPDWVEMIEDRAFKNNLYIESVYVPSSVTYIKEFAFSNCPRLKHVHISDGLEYVGVCAFYKCVSLQSINLPSSTSEIEESAFEGCISMQKSSCKGEYVKIGKRAFANCKKMVSFSHANSICTIGDEAFTYCSSLNKFTFKDIDTGIDSIGKKAFYECKNLTEVSIDYIEEALPESIFENCTNLRKVYIGYCEDIHDKAFLNCSSLCSCYIPCSVSSIGKEAFKGCIKLSKIYEASLRWDEIELYSIGDEAFAGSGIKILNTRKVHQIGERCFAGSPYLERVELGNNPVHIGKDAFDKCYRLKNVRLFNDNFDDPSVCELLKQVFVNDSYVELKSKHFDYLSHYSNVIIKVFGNYFNVTVLYSLKRRTCRNDKIFPEQVKLIKKLEACHENVHVLADRKRFVQCVNKKLGNLTDKYNLAESEPDFIVVSRTPGECCLGVVFNYSVVNKEENGIVVMLDAKMKLIDIIEFKELKCRWMKPDNEDNK